jgi:hypothetical protein
MREFATPTSSAAPIPVASRGKTTPDSVPKTCPQNARLGAWAPRVRLSTGSEPVDAPSTNPDPLLLREVLCSVHFGNKKAAFCSGFVVLEEPSDGLEPSTPSLPWNFARNWWQPVATVWLIFAPSELRRFAADCHRLQPRGSINAPSSVVRVATWQRRVKRGSCGARCFAGSKGRESSRSVLRWYCLLAQNPRSPGDAVGRARL